MILHNQTSEQPDSPTLVVEGALDAENAERLRAALHAAIASHPDITLDLSAVGCCGPGGLQVIRSARVSAERQGATLRVVHVPAAVEDAAALLGVPTTELGIAPGADTDADPRGLALGEQP